ncbi:PAS domain-containing sensor histidine kinase [Coraliomargarita sp. SDUM461004]|uniref:histidine kinase n=1 Tax=Thalassobacterium sedimentorum TaxID=3041258 RepID=A0ABU1AGZ1_9BACT|nr:PAS domain-containing sensor histidine kinase [Coraliomargarita sp. SDUM461004]MDQ8194079.1 PAS domain-containing sensor histidine kinase [Coraliomargarita sp. SDUM461004]
MCKSDREKIEYSVDPFFETSPNLLCIAGFDGYFKRINPAVCDTLGYSEAELMARPIRDFIHPDDLERTAQHRTAALKGKRLLNFENRYLHCNGRVVWLSWNSIPMVDSELVYAIAKDISHIKSREAQRDQLLTELTRTNQRLKHFTNATAHDIRSPVAGLVALSGLIDTSKIEDPATLEILEVLEHSAEDLMKMLNRYVDNLNAESHHSMLEVLNLEESFKQVTASIHCLIERSCGRIQLDFESCPEICFNRSYLEGIFMNLLSNSIKYAHPGRELLLQLRSRKLERGVELVFSDNGVGFDLEHNREHVFQMHQKFHDRADSKGVGLYLVHHYLTSLGGEISVASQVGEGTTFTLVFPDCGTAA